MKKLLIIAGIITGFTLNLPVLAQSQTLSISGSLMSGKTPVAGASVSLFKDDSILVKMQITDSNGVFAFDNLLNNKFHVRSIVQGFAAYNSDDIFLNSTSISLGNIQLKLQPQTLTTVTVQSKKPLLELKPDKLVMNVDAVPSNAGSTALEVLEKAPGVQVDKDGNISLKGKQGVMVLINGKPSYLDGADLANMLKGMQASQLDLLEIMTNPPAKYDASGNAGVINIKTKKIRTKGFNGNLNSNYSQGFYPKAGSSLNLNSRKNKLNIFSNLGYNYRGGFQQFDVFRTLYLPGTRVVNNTFEQHGFMPETRKTFNAKVGVDYDLSQKTVASLTFGSFISDMTYKNNINSHIYDAQDRLESSNIGNTLMNPRIRNYTANASLRHVFDSTGKELSFDGSYVKFRDDHRQSFYNSFFDKNGIPSSTPDTLSGHLPTGYDIYAFKADYSIPFTDKSTFETGLKVSYVASDNDIRFDSIINGTRLKDVNRTNHYRYKENIYAGYVNYNFPLTAKLKIQTGLRYEYTTGEGHSLTTGKKFSNKYGKLFPTLYASYEINDAHQFNVNYGRRISRPQYKDMNPFIFIIDRYTFLQGNPGLQPQFSHNVELSHIYKRSLNTTLNYSRVTGVVSEVIQTNANTKEATLIKRNIASKEQFGIAINYSRSINKWFSVTGNANVFNNRYKGVVNDTTIDLSAVSGNFYGALQFKFKNGWDAEVNGWFNTRGIDGISYDQGMGMFTVAGSKSVLKTKGKISLNIRDPFQLLRFESKTSTGSVDAHIISRWDNRAVTLGFNYRFGKQFKTNKRVEGSATEEQGRIGG